MKISIIVSPLLTTPCWTSTRASTSDTFDRPAMTAIMQTASTEFDTISNYQKNITELLNFIFKNKIYQTCCCLIWIGKYDESTTGTTRLYIQRENIVTRSISNICLKHELEFQFYRFFIIHISFIDTFHEMYCEKMSCAQIKSLKKTHSCMFFSSAWSNFKQTTILCQLKQEC